MFKNIRKLGLKSIVIKIVSIMIIAILLLCWIGGSPFKFDLESGSHRIRPTAMDKDFRGNYRLYYASNAIVQTNSSQHPAEGFYWIQKGNIEIIEQAEEALASGSEIQVFYDVWFGFKGFGTPDESPIIRIETVK